MTDRERGRRRATWAFLAVTGATAAGVATTGFLLADRYRPSAPFADPHPYPDVDRLVEVNDAAIGVLSGLALVLVVATLVPRVRGALRLSWWSSAAAVVAFVATFVAGVTRQQVQFEQVALWAVTVGDDFRGYRVATGDDVRFAIVDGVEVAPSTYEAVLSVHLAAPLLALASLAVIGWDVRRGRRPHAQNSFSTDDSMPRSSS